MSTKKSVEIALIIVTFIIIINIQNLEVLSIGIVLFSLYLLHLGVKDIKWLLLIIVAIIPVRSYNLFFASILGFEVSFNRLLIIIALVSFIAYKKKIEKSLLKNSTIIKLLLILTLFDLFSVFLGEGDIYLSLNKFISFFLEIFTFAVIYYKVFKKHELPLIVNSFSIGCLFLVLSVVIERITGMNLLFRFPTPSSRYDWLQDALQIRDSVVRVRGSFQNSVFLSGFLPLVMFASLYLLEILQKRIFGYTLFLGTIVAVILTVSRTATFSIIIVLIPYLIYLIKEKNFLQKLIIFFVVLPIIIGSVYMLFPADFNRGVQLTIHPTAGSMEGENTYGRIDILKYGVPILLAQNPFGLGFGSISEMSSYTITNDMANFYIGYWLSKGIVYILFFTFISLFMLKNLLLSRDKTGLLLAFLWMSLLATYFSYGQYYISFTLFLLFYVINFNFIHETKIVSNN